MPVLAISTYPADNLIPRRYPHLTDRLSWAYALTSTWVVGWVIAHMYFQRVVFSNDLWWLQYYVGNYAPGFVRRGLGGELIRIFAPGDYFTAAYAFLWASIVVWLIALAGLTWRILSTGARCQRKAMLALLAPVLPFSLSYAIYSPHPELFGMTALLAYSVSLTTARTPHARMCLSAVYGMVIAVLALMHEAIPLELALGAVLAIVVLAKDSARATQRMCTVLAVGPGLASTLLVAGLGRRDLAAQVCDQVPHGLIEHPWGVSTTPQKALDYMLGRVESRTDFHDFMCAKVIPIFDSDTAGAVYMVLHWGFFPLLGAFLLGVVYFAGTAWTIRYFSGVPIRAFLGELRHNLVLPLLGAALVVPLFVTAVDWTRWWILITFDVAAVYFLYAIKRPEIEQAPSRRSVLLFVYIVVALALLPTGAANNVGVWSVHLF
ncbi:hypothetical protein A5712_17600 [Mycobacterium sp. E2327]|uniref:hypothetical protein n=1 Tax=Mycobacterium sp. E2327 TaxID=1834132 RepID=UPI0007FD7AE6|nr:hypothetical protein [Mycobacterium sp. E2327]OBI20484.1 hypothetical protein A5712_17600 [Mycobacterium sp. E2327]